MSSTEIVNDSRIKITLAGPGDSAPIQLGGKERLVITVQPAAGSTVVTKIQNSAVALRSSSAEDSFWSKLPHIEFVLDIGQAVILIDLQD